MINLMLQGSPISPTKKLEELLKDEENGPE